ncbi:hypothetical protein GCM10029964_061090 [Kibdelosporangium lantanae]
MGTNYWWRRRRPTTELEVSTTTGAGVTLAGGIGQPLRLNVLGQVELLWHNDGRVRDLAEALTPKQLEILVFLALGPGRGFRGRR